MTFEANEFDELFIDTVTYEPSSVPTGFGETYDPATAKSVKAHIEQFARKVTDHQGREVVSNTRVHLKPTAVDGTSFTPTVRDRITLPAGYAAPLAPPILNVARVNDGQGLHHFEVSL